MTLIQHVKSGGKFEEIYRYSRLIRIGDWIMSSGTAGRNYVTREISADVTGQIHQAIANLTRALEPLVKLVKDGGALGRSAIAALGTLGDLRALDVLRPIAAGTDSGLASLAKDAITEIEDREDPPDGGL